MSLSRYSLLLLFILSPFSEAKKLVFFVGSPQFPPVIYKDQDTGNFQGIVPDILNSMPESSIEIEYIHHNRLRGEDALYTNEVDATILTKEWASSPEKLIFTSPIFKHRDFIYSDAPFPAGAELDTTITGSDVCARRGYTYPKLQQFFDRGSAKRIDTSSEETELKMLLLDRCHVAVVNEFIAEWLINNNNWQDDIYKLQYPLSDIDFTMAFTPDWQDFVLQLNNHISRIEESGELAAIISRNRGLD